MSSGERLTEQEFWEKKLAAGGEEAPDFAFMPLIAKHLPPGEGRSLLEVGASPGRILAQFSNELGYEVHGVDFAGDPAEMNGYLTRHGARVGELHRADFFDWEPRRKYDVVTSFGFIEHFEDAARVLDRHFGLTEPGGHVVVGVPNFRLGQHVLHWIFDRENLRRHNLSCMRRRFFEDAAERNGATVLYLRYCGGHYDFWRQQPRSVRLGVPETDRRVLLSPVSAAHLGLRALLGSRAEQGNPLLAPFLLAIYALPR